MYERLGVGGVVGLLLVVGIALVAWQASIVAAGLADEREYVVDIRLSRLGTDDTVLSGRFVVPASASRRVADLDSNAEFECLVRLGDEERRTSYEANRGQSLTLSIYDGEPSLGVEYTE